MRRLAIVAAAVLLAGCTAGPPAMPTATGESAREGPSEPPLEPDASRPDEALPATQEGTATFGGHLVKLCVPGGPSNPEFFTEHRVLPAFNATPDSRVLIEANWVAENPTTRVLTLNVMPGGAQPPMRTDFPIWTGASPASWEIRLPHGDVDRITVAAMFQRECSAPTLITAYAEQQQVNLRVTVFPPA